MPGTVSASYKTHTAASSSHNFTSADRPAPSSSNSTHANRFQWDRTFSNGDTYRGEAVHSQKDDATPIEDGKGCYTWVSSGAVYDGEWREGQPHGSGVMRVPGTDGYVYTGHFLHGKRCGKGRCEFANGRVYEGEWQDDEMNGEGVLYGAPNIDDFTEYRGTFRGGKRNGSLGRCVYASGDIYEGTWVSGKRQGQGELQLHRRIASSLASAAANPVRYRGYFSCDVPQANGTAEAEVEYADGSVYVGGTEALMRRNGKGVLRFPNGDVFEGCFVQDVREGRGVFQGCDGTVCEGYWHNDILDGEVHVTFPVASLLTSSSVHSPKRVDGNSVPPPSSMISNLLRLNQSAHALHPVRTYQGPCVAGVFTGCHAVITYADGSSYNGEVRNGVPHGAGVLRDRTLSITQGSSAIAGGAAVAAADLDSATSCHTSATCFPLPLSLTLVVYEGSFTNGEADGTGSGEWRVPSTMPVASPPMKGTFATPVTFMSFLADGLLAWSPTLLASLDGRYTGEWSRGLPHGQGTWLWADGTRYSGSVARYLPSGAGTLSNSAVQFTGELRDGQPEGEGVWEDRDRGLAYEGRWLAGQPHGGGVATLLGSSMSAASPSPSSSAPISNSRLYEGSWAAGKPSGHGREYASLDRQNLVYDGNYSNGLREGEGQVFFGATVDDSVAEPPMQSLYLHYQGAFLKGAPGGGAGCLTLRNKTTVEGHFDGELRPVEDTDVVITSGNGAWTFTGKLDVATHAGRGVMKFANGDVYDGEVEDASCSGEIARESPGQPYQSLFNLQRHGRGTYQFIEGNKLQCAWRHGVLHGTGTYTTSDGMRTERSYTDGVLSGDSVGGRNGVADTVAVQGNVFLPENEFPNTLSAEVLKSRMPESQEPSQPPQQQASQQRRQPFAFIRKGEARQASAAGESAAGSGAAAAVCVNATSPRAQSRRDPEVKRQQPSLSVPTQKRNSCTPLVSASAPNGSTAAGSSAATSSARRNSLAPAKSSTAAISPTQAQQPNYSLRRGNRTPVDAATQPNRVASATAPANARLPYAPGRMEGNKAVTDADASAAAGAATKAVTPTTPAYMTRFQAGIRQLDTASRASSPAPSSLSGISSKTSAVPAPSDCPSALPGSRGRLGTALAAGRVQQSESCKPLKPLTGSLKELMDAASAIRNTREDEIHLLTEEMRALNQRIWQLRFMLEAKQSEGATEKRNGRDGGSGPSPRERRGSVTSSQARTSGRSESKKTSVSKEMLAALVNERRIVMEKLQYVVNEPEDA